MWCRSIQLAGAKGCHCKFALGDAQVITVWLILIGTLRDFFIECETALEQLCCQREIAISSVNVAKILACNRKVALELGIAKFLCKDLCKFVEFSRIPLCFSEFSACEMPLAHSSE